MFIPGDRMFDVFYEIEAPLSGVRETFEVHGEIDPALVANSAAAFTDMEVLPLSATLLDSSFDIFVSVTLADGVVIDDDTLLFSLTLSGAEEVIIPEPSTLVLAAIGLPWLGGHRWRRRAAPRRKAGLV